MSQVDAIRGRQVRNRQKLEVLIVLAQVYRLAEWEQRLSQIVGTGNAGTGLVEALVTQVLDAVVASGNEPVLAQAARTGRKPARKVAPETVAPETDDAVADDVVGQQELTEQTLVEDEVLPGEEATE